MSLKLLLKFYVAALLLIAPATLYASEMDEATVKELVQQEVNRLLTTEGALDSAIEEGIKRIITKQRDSTNQDSQQQILAKLRPVDSKRDHIFGNPDAEITLVEYSDFECPFCKRFHPTVIRLLADNPDKIRWVYRHFPLEFHNPGAQKQAEASECVAELKGNDAFWKYTDEIYSRTSAGGKGFPLSKLRPLAEELSVDGDAFDKCLNSGRMAARVNEDHQDGMGIGISGTPAGILMNRQGKAHFIAGALPVGDIQAMVDDLLR